MADKSRRSKARENSELQPRSDVLSSSNHQPTSLNLSTSSDTEVARSNSIETKSGDDVSNRVGLGPSPVQVSEEARAAVNFPFVGFNEYGQPIVDVEALIAQAMATEWSELFGDQINPYESNQRSRVRPMHVPSPPAYAPKADEKTATSPAPAREAAAQNTGIVEGPSVETRRDAIAEVAETAGASVEEEANGEPDDYTHADHLYAIACELVEESAVQFGPENALGRPVSTEAEATCAMFEGIILSQCKYLERRIRVPERHTFCNMVLDKLLAVECRLTYVGAFLNMLEHVLRRGTGSAEAAELYAALCHIYNAALQASAELAETMPMPVDLELYPRCRELIDEFANVVIDKG